MKEEANGFSLVEILLFLAVVGVICVAGWYVIKSNNDADKKEINTRTFTSLTSTSDNPIIQEFITGMQDKNQALTFQLQSSAFTQLLSQHSGTGKSDFYDVCWKVAPPICSEFFGSTTALAHAKMTSNYDPGTVNTPSVQAAVEEDFTIPSTSGKGTAELDITAIHQPNTTWQIDNIEMSDPGYPIPFN